MISDGRGAVAVAAQGIGRRIAIVVNHRLIGSVSNCDATNWTCEIATHENVDTVSPPRNDERIDAILCVIVKATRFAYRIS